MGVDSAPVGFDLGLLASEAVHSDLLASWGVDSDCLKRTAFEGASCLSLTSPGFRGWIPHFLKPLKILSGVREFVSASATVGARIVGVIT